MIHPKDKTTAMLSALNDGLEAQVVDNCRSTKEMAHLFRHVSTQERIILLCLFLNHETQISQTAE